MSALEEPEVLQCSAVQCSSNVVVSESRLEPCGLF
jgi:hypothetical protein